MSPTDYENLGLSGMEDYNRKEIFITKEKLWQKVLRYVWWIFFLIAVSFILYRVFSGEQNVEFNLGGLPLN